MQKRKADKSSNGHHSLSRNDQDDDFTIVGEESQLITKLPLSDDQSSSASDWYQLPLFLQNTNRKISMNVRSQWKQLRKPLNKQLLFTFDEENEDMKKEETFYSNTALLGAIKQIQSAHKIEIHMNSSKCPLTIHIYQNEDQILQTIWICPMTKHKEE